MQQISHNSQSFFIYHDTSAVVTGWSRFRPEMLFVAVSVFAVCVCGCAKSHDKSTSQASKSAPSSPGKTKASAESTVSTTARFVDITSKTGVEFTYRNGEEADQCTLLESLGGGVSLLDYDSDGWLDIFLTGGGRIGKDQTTTGLESAVFRNRGNGTFENATQSSYLGFAPHYSHGSAVADFDHDGLPDLLMTGFGGVVLFHNMGDGTFVEITESSGLTDTSWSSSAAWGDLNNDGHLDFYVARYADWSWNNHPFCRAPGKREICPPRRFNPLPDSVYLNLGDGTFREASREMGLSTKGKGLGVVIADINLDRRADIYVGNDEEPNFLYRNAGDGKLEEIGPVSGTSRSEEGISEGSMGVDVGDFNNDGLPDIFVANYERETFGLYRNDRNFNFTHVSQAVGLTALGGLYVGWGSVLFDFDHDGDEDIFVINGHVIRYPTNAPLRQKPILLENRKGKRFVNVAAGVGEYFQQSHMGRGVAAGDLDQDGDIDLVVVRTNQPVTILDNQSKSQGNWISLRLIGTKSCRLPIGTVVFLTTTAGRQMRQVKGGGSYASTNDTRLHFGFGNATIQSVEIRWPSGITQTIDQLTPNQHHTIREQN